jgi:hypothetical protein
MMNLLWCGSLAPIGAGCHHTLPVFRPARALVRVRATADWAKGD